MKKYIENDRHTYISTLHKHITIKGDVNKALTSLLINSDVEEINTH